MIIHDAKQLLGDYENNLSAEGFLSIAVPGFEKAEISMLCVGRGENWKISHIHTKDNKGNSMSTIWM